MSIGKETAFACAAENGHQSGMSYRQWLIGQVLVGISNRNLESEHDFEDVASGAIGLADAVIRQLDASTGQKRPTCGDKDMVESVVVICVREQGHDGDHASLRHNSRW